MAIQKYWVKELREFSWVGRRLTRIDSWEKARGEAFYIDDLRLPNMLYAKIKRSPYPHAIIKSINVERATMLNQVKAVVTGRDFYYTYNPEHPPPVAVDKVRYVGEAVAALAAEDEETAETAIEEVDVEYEPLPHVLNAEEAMEDGNLVHETDFGRNIASYIKVRVGDIEKGFEESDIIVESIYKTQMVQHLPMGPLAILAEYTPTHINIYIGSQNANDVHEAVCKFLGVQPSAVRVIQNPYVGGWFGMKGDTELAAICAALSLKTKRPVKLRLSREEIFSTLAVRHPAKITIKDGVSNDGKLIARKIYAVFDGGAYARRSNILLKNVVFASTSVYKCKHFWLDAFRVYTNHVPSQNMRAPYGPQIVFAIESQMDLVAEKLRMDPLEFRFKNLVKDGEKSVIGEKMYSVDYERYLNEVKRMLSLETEVKWPWKSGVGFAVGAKWSPANSPFTALARLKADGKIEIWVHLVDVGQGIYTSIAQIAAETLAMNIEDIIVIPYKYGADSLVELAGTGPSGSRQLYNCGNAVIQACKDLKNKVLKVGSKLLSMAEEDLDFEGGYIVEANTRSKLLHVSNLFKEVPHAGKFVDGLGVLIGFGLWYEDLPPLDKDHGRATGDRVVAFYTPTAAGAKVSVNVETGEVRVEKLVVAVDVGKAINPAIVETQIIGGAVMGLGYALSEELILNEGGWIVNPNLGDYKPPYPPDVPEVVPLIIETPYSTGPYGARGVGEAPILAIAPAISNAIYNAVKVRLKELPMTREKVFWAIREKMRGQ
jgi:CO/xanthine dehydrogenase Mo-binding subunit